MEVFKGAIRQTGDTIAIEDETVGLKYLEDWISDIFGGIQPKHKAIEVRLKER